MHFEKLIKARYLLTPILTDQSTNGTARITDGNRSFKFLERAVIGINKNKIEMIALESEAPKDGFQAAEVISLADHIVMPGLINGHTHLAMSLFRGLADDEPFHKWLFETIFPLEAKHVDSHFVDVGVKLAALECVRMGTTTVCEQYFFQDASANALIESGMRGILGQGIIDFPTPDDPKCEGLAFKYLDELCEKYGPSAPLRPDLFKDRIMVSAAAHAPYTCSDALIVKVRDYAAKKGIRVQMHVAETKKEVDDSLSQFGKTPVKRLFDLGFLNKDIPSRILAHCVHLNDEDIEIVAKTGTSVVHNPESNMKLGSGVAPVPKMLQHGISVGLGTDGAASNNDLSMFREMDTAAKLQKLSHFDNTAMTAGEALRLATVGSARALGLEKEIGRLEVGMKADIIGLKMTYAHFIPINNVLSTIVYGASGQENDFTMVDGRVLYHAGHYLTLDPKRIRKDAEAIQAKYHSITKL